MVSRTAPSTTAAADLTDRAHAPTWNGLGALHADRLAVAFMLRRCAAVGPGLAEALKRGVALPISRPSTLAIDRRHPADTHGRCHRRAAHLSSGSPPPGASPSMSSGGSRSSSPSSTCRSRSHRWSRAWSTCCCSARKARWGRSSGLTTSRSSSPSPASCWRRSLSPSPSLRAS